MLITFLFECLWENVELVKHFCFGGFSHLV